MPEPEGLKYSKTHEWVKADGNIATVGITATPKKNWAMWPSSCRRKWDACCSGRRQVWGN